MKIRLWHDLSVGKKEAFFKRKAVWGAIALAVLVGASLFAVLLWNPMNRQETTYGEPLPQIEELRWGMSREEAISALQLKPDEYDLYLNMISHRSPFCTVSIWIPDKEFQTPYGKASDVFLTFVEDENEICSVGLVGSDIFIEGKNRQELRKILVESKDYKVKETQSELLLYGYAMELESMATVESSLPESLQQSLLDYLSNPTYLPNSVYLSNRYIEQGQISILNQKSFYETILPLPLATCSLSSTESGTHFNLAAPYPALFYALADNKRELGYLPLDWTSFDLEATQSINKSINNAFYVEQEGREFAFYGLPLSTYPKDEEEEVLEQEVYLKGIDLPAQRIVIRHSPYRDDVIHEGRFEWPLSDDAQRQELIEKLSEKLLGEFGEEAEVDPWAGAGIQHQWDDDQGNHIYLQNDPQDQAVRLIVEAG